MASVTKENHTTENAVNNEEQSNNSGDPPMTLDIVINNVVCSFNVRSHLDLRRIALTGANVEYKRENGMVTMKLRKPYTTASVWSSGKITCTGATSEEESKIAARRVARLLQKLGFKTRLCNFRVVNVLGTCTMPFAIRIIDFSESHKPTASYEPELHPGVTYKIKDLKATMKIFSTGSITVTAPSVQNVQAAIEHLFPIVYEFKKERSDSDKLLYNRNNKRQRNNHRKRVTYHHRKIDDDDDDDDSDDEMTGCDDDFEDDDDKSLD